MKQNKKILQTYLAFSFNLPKAHYVLLKYQQRGAKVNRNRVGSPVF